MKSSLYAMSLAGVLASCAIVQPNDSLAEAEASVNATKSIWGIDDVAAVSMIEARRAPQPLRPTEDAAAQMVREIDELKTRQGEHGIVLTLEDTFFEFRTGELQPGRHRAGSGIAGIFKMYRNRQVLIEGHTDSLGDAPYNETLSTKRAESVTSTLSSMDVLSQGVSLRGLVEAFPVARNSDGAGRPASRRVALIAANQNGAEVDQSDECLRL